MSAKSAFHGALLKAREEFHAAEEVVRRKWPAVFKLLLHDVLDEMRADGDVPVVEMLQGLSELGAAERERAVHELERMVRADVREAIVRAVRKTIGKEDA